MLRLEHLRKSFGGFEAVKDCTLSVEPREIVGLIGPNGAGKTTVFDLVTGVRGLDDGRVFLGDRDITGLSVERVAMSGLVRTFQVPRLFRDLSVIENLLVAAPDQHGERFWNVWFRPGRIRQEERGVEAAAWQQLEFLGLGHIADRPAGQLSGGQQKLLELGRALMARPSIVLLDEPVAGVSPRLMDEIADRVRRLRDGGLTLLLVEHRMEFVMALCDRIYVMAEGRVIAQGTPEVVQRDETVLDAYLGVV